MRMIEKTYASPFRAGALMRIGHAMVRHQKVIRVIQWTMVALYAFLLLAPLFLPPPGEGARLFNNLRLLVQFLFWGVGWPLIMLSMMLVGRVWCGIFCPDGTLTEAISRRGRKGSIPRWIRWSGWPCTMLVVTTVYGQLVGVYDFHTATLLLLGLPTVGAILTGYLYGNGRRIWCMYLCPANGVFSLIAKIAPVHFRVDEQQWKAYSGHTPRIECPPLIDIQRMKSTSDCHACGRCVGYRNAVELGVRMPHSEIVATERKNVRTAEAVTLLFGIFGVCTAAMQWHSSAAYGWVKSYMTNLLAPYGLAALQKASAPWWLLANHPEANIVFSLFDGVCLLLYVLGGGALFAFAVGAMIWLAARFAADPELSWQRLALALIPLAGMGLFLGLSTFTVMHLQMQGVELDWAPMVRAALLAAAGIFSAYLGLRMIAAHFTVRKILAQLIFLLPVGLICLVWLEHIF